MSNSTKILLLLVALLVIIGAGAWWFVATQNNNQPVESVLTPATDKQATPPTQTQNQNQNQPVQPTTNQTPASNNAATPAPVASLTNGNTDDDISKDLANVDGQMNNLNSDVTNSNQAVTPVTVQ